MMDTKHKFIVPWTAYFSAIIFWITSDFIFQYLFKKILAFVFPQYQLIEVALILGNTLGLILATGYLLFRYYNFRLKSIAPFLAYVKVKIFNNYADIPFSLFLTLIMGLISFGVLGFNKMDYPLKFGIFFLKAELLTDCFGIPICILTVRYIFVAIFEELLYRGVFLKKSTSAYGVVPAVIITNIFFVLMHMAGNATTDFLCILNWLMGSLFFTYIRLKYNSIFLSICCHFAINSAYVSYWVYGLTKA